MRFAREHTGIGGKVVATIFVNPTQFGPSEDFERYPRTLEVDLIKCAAAGVDAVFAPSVAEVYPDGLDNLPVQPPLPAVATQPGLEDARRPGHFEGVCRVVRRMFQLVRPLAAIFGQKDYQQLLTIKAMVELENLGVEVIGRPTLRDSDGLALSSRNVFLSPAQRSRALGLSRAISAARRCAANGTTIEEAERAMRSILLAHQVAVEYAVVRDGQTLMPTTDWAGTHRALIAGRVGRTRLIDNDEVGAP